MQPERKINLLNAFGKASALTGTAAGVGVYYELGRVAVALTDVSQTSVNPADCVAPGLIAFAISLSMGLAGTYMGHAKRRLVDEFNYQVKQDLQSMGLELVEDENDSKANPQYRKIPQDDFEYRRPVIVAPSNNSFWQAFYISSLMNNNSSSGYSSSSRRSSNSSSSNSSNSSNKGQAMAFAVAIGVLLAAAAASAYVSYKALKMNFSKGPELLTKPPEPNALA
jgi:hypothetical protein